MPRSYNPLPHNREQPMNTQNYTASLAVDQTPDQVFAAITNPRGWWSEQIEGRTEIMEFVPGKKVVWHVVENYFDFVEDKTEWTGTDVVFEIGKQGNQTELRFTHVGLVPAYQCYNVCSDAWGTYVKGSLRDLITTRKGQPNPIEGIVARAREMALLDQTNAARMRSVGQ